MAIEFDETEQASEPQRLVVNESILSGYEQPKEVDAPEAIAPALDGDPKKETEASVSQGSWEGNPEYYQSGDKKGQKRNRKIKATIDKNAVTSIPGSYIVTAAMFLMLVDTIIPMILVGLNNWVTDTKIDLEDVRLKREIRKEIEPLGDATLKQLNLTGNPGLMLILAMSCHYSWNFMLARVKAKNEPKIEKK